jgi:16S rRNA (uracil1498-N3)-methyltransferase
MPCFYVPQLTNGVKSAIIEGEEFHHLINVFRKRKGDEIQLTDGNGTLSEAIIEQIDKKSLKVRVLSQTNLTRQDRHVAVAFSLLKNKNDNLIVEKLTELGIDEFFPFIAYRTVRQKGDNTEERFVKTAISAVKQCDNPFLPKINNVSELKTLLDELKIQGYSIYVALERQTATYLNELIKPPFPKMIALFVGPEGGFTDEEIMLFNSSNV